MGKCLSISRTRGTVLDYDYFGLIRYYTGDAKLSYGRDYLKNFPSHNPPAAILAVVPPQATLLECGMFVLLPIERAVGA